MYEQVSKVFKPARLTQFLQFSTAIAFLMAASRYFLIYMTKSVFIEIIKKPTFIEIFEIFLMIGLIGAAFLTLISVVRKLTITSNRIIRLGLFGEQIILLSAVLRVRNLGSSLLIIQIDQSRSNLGLGFSLTQTNEAYDYILEQILINYPENYETVKRNSND